MSYQSPYANSSTYMDTNGGRMVTGGMSATTERVQSTRKVSSTIVDEQFLGPIPQDYPSREVEVPGPVQEVITYVPRKEIVETERRVPKYEYEYVDRIVEVPRIEYVDRIVEVPQYKEVIREVRVPQVVDVPREVIREVKVPRINYIEEVREVPGQIIEVPKPYTVEQKIEFTRYTDRMKPVVVAQTVKPYIVEGAGVHEVDVYEYEPECIPVDVHVVKAVQAQIHAAGVIETSHRVVSVPVPQYNTILQQLNSHLTSVEIQRLPYMNDKGQVTFLSERAIYSEPQHGVPIEGLDHSRMVNVHIDHSTRKTHNVPQTRPTYPDAVHTSRPTIGHHAMPIHHHVPTHSMPGNHMMPMPGNHMMPMPGNHMMPMPGNHMMPMPVNQMMPHMSTRPAQPMHYQEMNCSRPVHLPNHMSPMQSMQPMPAVQHMARDMPMSRTSA